MIKLQTPLVIGTLLVVAVLGVTRLVLVPDAWASSIAALGFIPIAIGVAFLQARSISDPQRARKISGRLRASLVGAGVLLATALLLSITDRLGITGKYNNGDERSLLVLLPAIIATAADLLSTRLEQKAEKERD